MTRLDNWILVILGLENVFTQESNEPFSKNICLAKNHTEIRKVTFKKKLVSENYREIRIVKPKSITVKKIEAVKPLQEMG